MHVSKHPTVISRISMNIQNFWWLDHLRNGCDPTPCSTNLFLTFRPKGRVLKTPNYVASDWSIEATRTSIVNTKYQPKRLQTHGTIQIIQLVETIAHLNISKHFVWVKRQIQVCLVHLNYHALGEESSGTRHSAQLLAIALLAKCAQANKHCHLKTCAKRRQLAGD